LGGLRPPKNNRMFIAALCGGAAWTADVNIVRRIQPPSQPPPRWGRAGEEAVTVPAEPRRGGAARTLGPFASDVVRHAYDRLT